MQELKSPEVKTFKEFLVMIGEISIFSSKFFTRFFKRPYELRVITDLMFEYGYKSVFLASTTIFIIGLVITIQLTPRMEDLGAAALVPNMLAVSLIREVGPVLTALVVAGKVGSAIRAEIGAMKVTEQIDAMAVSGTDPYKYLVITRVIATTLTLPILTIYSFAVGLTGSYVAYNLERDMSLDLFFNSAFINMNVYDVVPSIIKSFLFGFSIGMVSCFFGYQARKGASGVGQVVNAAIVHSFLLIFFIDMLAAQITHILTR